jgi:hypothetical protein
METFISLKDSLVFFPIVNYPRKHKPSSQIVDASTDTDEIKGGCGAMLCQTDMRKEKK